MELRCCQEKYTNCVVKLLRWIDETSGSPECQRVLDFCLDTTEEESLAAGAKSELIQARSVETVLLNVVCVLLEVRLAKCRKEIRARCLLYAAFVSTAMCCDWLHGPWTHGPCLWSILSACAWMLSIVRRLV